MKVYKINLTSLGEITKLPDSQQIFGALIYRLVDLGKDDAYIAKLFTNVQIKQVSNFIPEGYIPNIYAWDDSVYSTQIGEVKYQLQNDGYKSNAGKGYKDKQYQTAIGNNKQLRIQSTFKDMNNTSQIEEGNGGVFSQNHLKILEDNEIKHNYFFLIECTEAVYQDLFEVVDDEVVVFRLGARVSRGMNMYEVESCSEVALLSGSTTYMNIGMLGLNNTKKFDMEKSHLRTYQSKRKGYVDYKSEAHITYIAEGSVIQLNNDEKIETHVAIADKRYLYTGGFLLPIQKQEAV